MTELLASRESIVYQKPDDGFEFDYRWRSGTRSRGVGGTSKREGRGYTR